MNGSLSDGNDNILDIFVLSTSTTDSPLQARDLENLGYRATFFSSAQQLFESLRSGKPNLLICDSVTLPQDSYDLCRAIKADYDLWVVPVLIVTSASSLSDLLHVLDCNADNFISLPYDPSYFSALIEGMLTTPVERPTPEQIKTQFKIQHDDNQFVVTADRRRLLEFLLSSFEIAVNRSGDIIRITSEKDGLSATVEKREERVRDQARSIEALNSTLRQKEQEIGSLSSEVAERDRQIREHLDEIRKYEGEIEAGKSHIAAAEGEINRLTGEAADLARRYTLETGDLSQQLATISEHLATTSADLKAAEESLALETSQKTDAETLLSETVTKKEQAEKMVHELALEVEQVKADILAEKEKVQNLVTEIASLNEAKIRVENELAGTIRELNDTITKTEADLSFRTQEREEERTRVSDLETQLADLWAAKRKVEEELQARIDTSAREQSDLRGILDRTQAMLESREQDLACLKTELDEVTGAGRSAEEWMTGEIRERDATIKELQGQHVVAQETLEDLKQDLDRVRTDLDAALATKSAAESSLENASARIRDLEAELEKVCASGMESGRQVTNLRNALGEAEARIHELDSGLKTAITGGAETAKQIHALTDELEQKKAELENSLKVRHTLEESLDRERQEKEKLSADLARESRERESLAAALVNEEQVRRDTEAERGNLRGLLASAESEGNTRESALSDTICELKAELDSSLALRRELEAKVQALVQEKQVAEEKAASLDREIEQARSALADEWEGHVDAQERLVAAAGTRPYTGTSPAELGELDSEKARKRALIVKGPELPVTIGKHPLSLSPAQAFDPAQAPAPRIRNVEDLFEEEPEAEKEPETLPAVSIVQEVAYDDQQEDRGFSDITATDSQVPDYEPDEELPDEEESDEEEESDDEEISADDETEIASDDDTRISSPSPEISFSRAQWYDLLKWAHHSGTLTQEQRMQIVRMGRLIQKGRRLTNKQVEQVKEMLILVQAQGYRFM